MHVRTLREEIEGYTCTGVYAEREESRESLTGGD